MTADKVPTTMLPGPEAAPSGDTTAPRKCRQKESVDWARERLLQVLGTEVHRHWGSIRALEEGLDLSPGYLSRIAAGTRDIHLDRFFRCLDRLPVSVERFFARAIRPDADHLLETLPFRHREPQAVQQLRRIGRRLSSGPHIDHPATDVDTGELLQRLVRRSHLQSRVRFLRKEGAWRRPESIEGLLTHLETLRMERPRDAAHLARIAAAEIIPSLELDRRAELFCRAIESFTAAQGRAGHSETAARACRLSLEMADRFQLGDRLRAGLLRQASRILGDYRRYHDALDVSAEASAIYARHGSSAGLGRSYVDQGRLLFFQGATGLSETTFRAALRLLPNDAMKSRFAAFHGNAVVSHQLGRHQEALNSLDQAEACLADVEGYERALIDQLRGHIALATGRPQDACRSFEDARAALQHLNPLDLALATYDLMQAHLEAKQPAEALRLARGTAALLRPLRAHPAAESAVMSFLRALGSEGLSLALIEKARRKIHRGLGRHGKMAAERWWMAGQRGLCRGQQRACRLSS